MADPEVGTAKIISGGGICEEKMVRKLKFPFGQKVDAPPRLIYYPPKAFAGQKRVRGKSLKGLFSEAEDCRLRVLRVI